MDKPISISKYFLPVVFMGLLILPYLNQQLGLWEFERKSENRSFQDSLNFQLKKLDEFPGDADAYVKDNFSFRTPLLEWYHSLKFNTFKISPHQNKSLIGKKGWYFMSGKEKDIYEGKMNFSSKELDHFYDEWSFRKKYLDSMQIKCYWIIAPFKHYVYSEYLPQNVGKSKVRRVDQIIKRFNRNMPNVIIDPLPLLIKEKENNKMFYKLDNHWSEQAGYLTTQLLLEKLRIDFPDANIPDIPEVVWQDTLVHKGIHYDVMGIEDLGEIRQLPTIVNSGVRNENLYGFKCVEGFAYPWEYEKRMVNDHIENGLRILLIRDSFADALKPFIPELFKETVMIFDAWQYKLNEEIIEEVKPDIVVFLNLETHLSNIVKNANRKK